LVIYAPELVPRLAYACYLAFDVVCPVRYRLTDSPVVPPGVPVLACAEAVPEGVVGYRLPPHPVLGAAVAGEGPPGLPLESELHPLAAVFRLVTECDAYGSRQYDTWGRYPPPALPLPAHDWATHHVSRLLEAVAIHTGRAVPTVPRPATRQLVYTFDLDNPWLHTHKPWYVQAGGLARALARADLPDLRERLAVLTGLTPDPNDTLDRILDAVSGLPTVFFWLLGGESTHDNRFTPGHRAWVRAIRRVQASGAVCGIHPSFLSPTRPDLLHTELNRLEDILGQKVTHSRQHFLRYRLPDTFRMLEAAGITDDYTTCYPSGGGFRHGVAHPFDWFDAAANRRSGLVRHPTVVMDRAWLQAGVSPAEAATASADLIGQAWERGAPAVVLFHNEVLSEVREWRGWSPYFYELVRLASRTG
jgi:hypothetical protein